MAEICVFHLSDDEAAASTLVAHLASFWSVWWDRDIVHGDWEEAVRRELKASKVVIAVLSERVVGHRKAIVKDEMRLAKEEGKPLIIFALGDAEMPLGLGDLDRIDAPGWRGDTQHEAVRELVRKVQMLIHPGQQLKPLRPTELAVFEKILPLPAFVFSLSSHETRIGPLQGLQLLNGLRPEAALVSAYDASAYPVDQPPSHRFRHAFDQLCHTQTMVFLDSGNYEASRIRSFASRRNPAGWSRRRFLDVARAYPADIAFAFDDVEPKGAPTDIIDKITEDYYGDVRALGDIPTQLCPIVHVPEMPNETLTERAAEIVAGVARALDPVLLAIPERELGDGLRDRVQAVRAIRKELDATGRYYPLHLLGTGNPLTMNALSVAGADVFDGLEWCRTTADYQHGLLYHFSHFDAFAESCLYHVTDAGIRALIQDPAVPYATRTLSYNVDFFQDWARTMRRMISEKNQRLLLKAIPHIGVTLLEADLNA